MSSPTVVAATSACSTMLGRDAVTWYTSLWSTLSADKTRQQPQAFSFMTEGLVAEFL